MTSQTRTRQLAGTLARTTARNTAWTAAALGAWAVAAGLAPATGDVATTATPPDRVTVLVERHGCWSGTAPLGAPDPTRAVVTLKGERAKVVEAAVGYEIWLGDRRGTLHAFCP